MKWATSVCLGIAIALTATARRARAATPDTLLGIRDVFGEISYVDDDGSPLGDGHASGAMFVPTNGDEISFAVSGYPDQNFTGSHDEAGGYEVRIEVYDFFGDVVDSFGLVRMLEPAAVHEFNFSNIDWLNGNYDVAIDNLVNIALGDADLDGDVDLSDLGNLASNYGADNSSVQWADGDFDYDDDVDLNDLGTLATNFEGRRDAAFATFEALVPEPATAGMLILALIPTILRRPRR